MSIITTGTTITAGSINSIITTASAVLSTAYGTGMISQPVTAGSPITTTEWINLVSDLRRCWIHQTGSLSGFPTVSSLPVPGDVITAKFGNTLQNIAKTVNDNVYVVPPVNQTQQFALASSTSTIYSVNNLTYQVDHTFTDNANANYFFNLGGRISAGLSRASGVYIGNTATWASFIDWANSQISSLAYSRNQWAVSTSINEIYTSSTNYVVRLGIFARDNRTIRSTLTVTTAELSGVPTIGTATATGTTTANVSFTAPASNGGAAITSYTATSNPGGRIGILNQAGSGTITVTGLTAGTAYTFTVTATNSVGTSAASGASNSITTYSVPVNTVAPVVSGTATAGQVLTSTTGTWTGTPTPTYAYRWQRAGVDISGATGSTYTLVSDDTGSAIRCVVTASNSAGRASANSNATSSVAAAVPVNTVAPVVSGTATVGQTLTTTTGTWTGTPTPTYAYRWQRAGVDISDATNSTYTLVGADLGSAVRCVVTASNSAGSASANSNVTSSVTAVASGTIPVNTVAPVVSGTATAGQVLTSTTGTWTGTPTYVYQWQRAGVNISGAASSTYTLVSADVGSAIRCVVTASNSAGSASANSNVTSSVTAVASGTVPVNTVAPVVSGTATAGQVLTSTTGTWTGTPTPTYAYRWQRAGVNISGAIGSTYTLVSADVGSAVRCVVTASNSAGSASANSNATGPVAAATEGPPTYEIIPMATSVVEGMDFTFYVRTTNVPDGTELVWFYDSPRSGTSSPDFENINGITYSGSIYINGSIGSITLTARDDGTNEGTETFTIKLFRPVPGGVNVLVAESDPIIIYEVSAIDPASQKYTITPAATTVTEGVTLKITVDTVNVPDGTELLWVYDSPTSNQLHPDFQDVNTGIYFTYGGTIVIYGNSANFEIRATDDGVNEGTETFTIKLFRLVPGSNPVLVKTSDPITIYELYAL